MFNILVINSLNNKNKPLVNLFKSLEQSAKIFFWSDDQYFLNKLGPSAIKKNFGPDSPILFYVAWPVLLIYYFFQLFSLKLNSNISAIICVSEKEKNIFTPLASFLKIKVIWLEVLTGKKITKNWLLKFFSKQAKIVVFTSAQISEFESKGFNKENLINIFPGVDLDSAIKQENIFSPLAMAEKPYRLVKNFAIGSLVNPEDNSQLEVLLRAVQNCCNVIPNIQLIVIGRMADRHNSNWLVKKMGLEGRVWFVGEQEEVAKWFDGLDLYVSASIQPNLYDLETMILAMSRAVPVISFSNFLVADFLIADETGFLSIETADDLSGKIIAIEPDKRLLKKVGENGQELIKNYFSREKQVERLVKIVN